MQQFRTQTETLSKQKGSNAIIDTKLNIYDLPWTEDRVQSHFPVGTEYQHEKGY
jgi:hypothetical protein